MKKDNDVIFAAEDVHLCRSKISFDYPLRTLEYKKGIMIMLPKDPFILFSYINTQLRDRYSSLENLCDDLDVSEKEICCTLEQAGFVYSPEKNRFE